MVKRCADTGAPVSSSLLDRIHRSSVPFWNGTSQPLDDEWSTHETRPSSPVPSAASAPPPSHGFARAASRSPRSTFRRCQSARLSDDEMIVAAAAEAGTTAGTIDSVPMMLTSRTRRHAAA